MIYSYLVQNVHYLFQFLQVFKCSCASRLFTFSSPSQRPQRSNENHVDNLTALSMSSSSVRWASPCPPTDIEPFQRSPPAIIFQSTSHIQPYPVSKPYYFSSKRNWRFCNNSIIDARLPPDLRRPRESVLSLS